MTDRTIYVAEFRYDRPGLAHVTVKRETPKTFVINNVTRVTGFVSIGRRIFKERQPWFDTLDEAVSYLISRAKDHLKDHQKDVIEAQATLAFLEAFRASESFSKAHRERLTESAA